MTLHSEIFEQPERLKRLLVSQRGRVEEVAAAIKSRKVPYVFLAARGTSDNAARYANYLLGAMNGLPVALATPSLFTYYQRPPSLSGALVVGVSQSGISPDIVSVVQEGRRQGCLTLSITNDPSSPLGRSADFVLGLEAGPELAIAATKTYTAELMVIAMLSSALRGPEHAEWEQLEKVPKWVGAALTLEADIAKAAGRYRSLRRCVVLGRGYNYATAFEWALKLKELAYVAAEPYSSADFQHGPIAAIGEGSPVLAVVASGDTADSMLPLLQHLKQDLHADLVVVSNLQRALSFGDAAFPISPEIPEAVTPLVSIVVAQLFSYHLTLALGYDPENPRMLNKVTETR
jgi:glucosamine--fructose-6-phosphate aminotransferase (isomerizing)